MRRRTGPAFLPLICGALAVVHQSPVWCQEATATLTSLRCEYARDPLGLGIREPRLFWQISSSRRGERQTAYQVIVASDESRLDEARADLWNSGRVESDQTTHVVYAGVPLGSRQRAVWRVRAWDRGGLPSAWSAVGRFEMGLLLPTDWTASWVGWPLSSRQPDAESPVEKTSAAWIWAPEGTGATESAGDGGQSSFRYVFDLPTTRAATEASWLLASRGSFRAWINGRLAGEQGPKSDPERLTRISVTRLLQPGRNVLAVEAGALGSSVGLAGLLQVTFSDGGLLRVATASGWKAARATPSGWEAEAYDDSAWAHSLELGPVGEQSWDFRTYRSPEPRPATYLRSEFALRAPVAHARAYATARGIYELRVNGQRMGHEFLRPGWTDYTRRIQYQTYDVTSRLRRGPNAVGVVVADGWYAGHIGTEGRGLYGEDSGALVQIEVFYEDGSAERIVTNGSWRVARGPILATDLIMGETYDARREMSGWDLPHFDDSEWRVPAVASVGPVALTAQVGPGVERLLEILPLSVREAPPGSGVFVFDLGQNMVGWTRLKVQGEAGTTVRLRFAEALKPDGSIYTANLRGAQATDSYTLRGGEKEVFEPSFTTHGFRYVELSGFPGTPSLDAITGVVLGTATPPTGSLETSNSLVNRIQSNISWSQRGSSLDVPAQGPQRDERLGGMGGASVFAPTACFNAEVAGFLTKWLQDVRDAQSPEGAFSDVAPVPGGGHQSGAPGWGDAGILVPWSLYQCYGDTRVLATQYEAMKRWVDWVREANPDLLWVQRSGNNYGDESNVDADSPREVIATAYFAWSTRLLAQTARVLGHEADAADFDTLFERIRAAFNRAFVQSDGRIQGETQTVYLLALHLDLIPEDRRPMVATHLVRDIVDRRGYHLSTGLLGVGHLNPTLSAIGRTDLAYRLLLSDTYPSWGYTIRHGATTTWERWDGSSSERGFHDPSRNSLNHSPLGSVGAWLYSVVGGIASDPEGPGYSRILLHPVPGGGLTSAKASLETLHGRVESHWRIQDGRVVWEVLIPANTRATVFVPTSDPASVLEGGRPATDAAGLRQLRAESGAAVFEAESGRYVFDARAPAGRY